MLHVDEKLQIIATMSNEEKSRQMLQSRASIDFKSSGVMM